MKFHVLAAVAATLVAQVSAAPEPRDDNLAVPPYVEHSDRLPDDYQFKAGKVPGGNNLGGNTKSTNANRVRIRYMNRDNTSIIIGHSVGKYSPDPHYGDFHIQPQQDAVLTYPYDYSGIAFVNLDSRGYRLTKVDESAVEISYKDVPPVGRAGDVDVSYVGGFSRAISCRCEDNNLTVGCSKELWAKHHCPDDNRVGSCRNPHKNGPEWATDFFKPCTFHGGAFTYPTADANTLYGRCPSENYLCCIGHGSQCASYNSRPRD